MNYYVRLDNGYYHIVDGNINKVVASFASEVDAHKFLQSLFSALGEPCLTVYDSLIQGPVFGQNGFAFSNSSIQQPDFPLCQQPMLSSIPSFVGSQNFMNYDYQSQYLPNPPQDMMFSYHQPMEGYPQNENFNVSGMPINNDIYGQNSKLDHLNSFGQNQQLRQDSFDSSHLLKQQLNNGYAQNKMQDYNNRTQNNASQFSNNRVQPQQTTPNVQPINQPSSNQNNNEQFNVAQHGGKHANQNEQQSEIASNSSKDNPNLNQNNNLSNNQEEQSANKNKENQESSKSKYKGDKTYYVDEKDKVYHDRKIEFDDTTMAFDVNALEEEGAIVQVDDLEINNKDDDSLGEAAAYSKKRKMGKSKEKKEEDEALDNFEINSAAFVNDIDFEQNDLSDYKLKSEEINKLKRERNTQENIISDYDLDNMSSVLGSGRQKYDSWDKSVLEENKNFTESYEFNDTNENDDYTLTEDEIKKFEEKILGPSNDYKTDFNNYDNLNTESQNNQYWDEIANYDKRSAQNLDDIQKKSYGSESINDSIPKEVTISKKADDVIDLGPIEEDDEIFSTPRNDAQQKDYEDYSALRNDKKALKKAKKTSKKDLGLTNDSITYVVDGVEDNLDLQKSFKNLKNIEKISKKNKKAELKNQENIINTNIKTEFIEQEFISQTNEQVFSSNNFKEDTNSSTITQLYENNLMPTHSPVLSKKADDIIDLGPIEEDDEIFSTPRNDAQQEKEEKIEITKKDRKALKKAKKVEETYRKRYTKMLRD
ncbi:hypothetical protein SGLAD_v1c00270 [Spiroplasma gladiatoris]|uniref:Uncharacterized protein n=1 Tax=Spiroplasma gladiatoris TaxID=2143 RepID=A0A4P7AHT1_9MOLU|nr:hypothetical protein [Spiroplasma gladiatoris]QBQ07228.1 hypothetical protein SGLAD_v1c00270 [Spiroplasma gladiatoris]